MTIRTRITTAGAALASAGLLVATPTAQAAPDGADRVLESHVEIYSAVLDGRLDGRLGNQHRLTYRTDDRWGSASRLRTIQSYYCPSGTGAKITAGWTSSRCISRGTRTIELDDSDYRVSSTMRSARVDGSLTSGWQTLDADLTLMASEDATTERSPLGDGGTARVADARLYGSLDDARVRSGEHEARLYRYER